jgi:hypothetical protein
MSETLKSESGNARRREDLLRCNCRSSFGGLDLERHTRFGARCTVLVNAFQRRRLIEQLRQLNAQRVGLGQFFVVQRANELLTDGFEFTKARLIPHAAGFVLAHALAGAVIVRHFWVIRSVGYRWGGGVLEPAQFFKTCSAVLIGEVHLDEDFEV